VQVIIRTPLRFAEALLTRASAIESLIPTQHHLLRALRVSVVYLSP
jgi:hypothetical protein